MLEDLEQLLSCFNTNHPHPLLHLSSPLPLPFFSPQVPQQLPCLGGETVQSMHSFLEKEMSGDVKGGTQISEKSKKR